MLAGQVLHVPATPGPGGELGSPKALGKACSMRTIVVVFMLLSTCVSHRGFPFGDTIQTPADSTTPDALGGWTVVWSACQPVDTSTWSAVKELHR